MKKLFCVAATCIISAALLASCGGNSQKDEKFNPSLDTTTKCSITVVGDYSNFEALEAEFTRFNAYYPNVSLTYEKVDDYTNNLPTVLNRADKPNIFFSYAAWMAGDEKYATAVSKMEDLSDPALKLNLDCIRPGLLNRDNGKVSMVPLTLGTVQGVNIEIRRPRVESSSYRLTLYHQLRHRRSLDWLLG